MLDFGSSYGPLGSLQGSELWAPVFRVFYNGVLCKDSEVGAHTKDPHDLVLTYGVDGNPLSRR